MADRPQVISTVKARAGVTPHIVRYVLAVSLLLAVAAMAFVFMRTPVVPQPEPTTVAAQQ